MGKLAITGTALVAALSLTDAAEAQRRIFGADVRNYRTFRSSTAGLTGYYTHGPAMTADLLALDFDASASRIYAIDDVNDDVWTIDHVTMEATPLGIPITGIIGSSPSFNFISGLSSHPTDGLWYMSRMSSGGTQFYSGDVTTGAFTFLSYVPNLYFLDIAIDRNGVMFALEGNSGVIYQIDPASGMANAFVITNSMIQFAQGMDFDWRTNTLYAALYYGGGAGDFVSIDLGTQLMTVIEDTSPLDGQFEIAIEVGTSGPFGDPYCAANANSAGLVGEARAIGSALVVDDTFSLQAYDLPNFSWGFFIASRTSGFVANPGGSQGNLCVVGAIGRYVGAGQIQNTGGNGSFTIPAPLNAIPQPNGFESVQPGDTWYFQAWHRDLAGGAPTSNFSRGLSVRFF